MSKKQRNRKIKDLASFLSYRGFSINDGPYYWARCFYKYVDCGPWVVFLLDDGREVYYEDKGVNETVTNDNCTGIKFGSIVEGSEQCAGPYTHLFPFKEADFDRDCDTMEAETSFYWKRDNASWYCVSTDKAQWSVANVWGDIEWEGEPPEAIKLAAEAAIKNDWQDDPEHSGCIVQTIPQMPRWWRPEKPSDKEWEPLKLGDTGAEIYTFENDTTFD